MTPNRLQHLSLVPEPHPFRVAGVLRVSHDTGGVSTEAQREKLESLCASQGWKLDTVREELDVSGGSPLSGRHGLRGAVEDVEAGKADLVAVAFFDRAFRDLVVQAEVLERLKAVGSALYAGDIGLVNTDTANGWYTAAMLGASAQHYRLFVNERTTLARHAAIDRGEPTFSRLPPGLRFTVERRIELDPELAPVTREAVSMRLAGKSLREIRAYLAEHGVKRSEAGIAKMFQSPLLKGELHCGTHKNLSSHEALIDPPLWQRLQEVRAPKGRKAKSERLLARLGVLRCGTCDSRMVVGASSTREQWPYYRCVNPDCHLRQAISAKVAEGVVVAEVQRLLQPVAGEASHEDEANQARAALALAQDKAKNTVQALTGFEDLPGTRDKLEEVKAELAAAQRLVDEWDSAEDPARRITAEEDWTSLSLDGQRALIQVAVSRAAVHPGRGAGRITVEPRRRK